MEFRLAKINDLPAVQAMYRALISDLRARGLDLWSDYYPCEFFIRDIEMNRLYLLSEGETPAAAFALDDSTLGSESVPWTFDAKKPLYLERLGVNPRFLRRGLGSFALSKAKETAKSRGADCLRLFVIETNAPAMALYEKNAFEKIDRLCHETVDAGVTLHGYGYQCPL